MTDEVKVSVSEALANNYLLAKLQVRIWSGRKTDKTATAELLADKGAVSNAAAVVKNLFAGKDGSLKDTHASYTRIRTWFYEHTVPWTTASVGAMKGDRLIATKDSINFLSEFAKLKKEAEVVKQEFLNEYDQLVQDVGTSLGGLYDPTQYPTKQAVANMFGAEMHMVPVPETSDFSRLTNVPADLVTGLQGLYERNVEAQMNNALNDVQSRLMAELERMDTQLSKVAKGEKTRLFKSMVGNLKHLVGMARSMNFTDNPAIESIADKIEQHLLQHEVDAYKDNASLARVTAEQARSIAEDVKDNDNWSVNDAGDTAPLPDNITVDDSQETIEANRKEFDIVTADDLVTEPEPTDVNKQLEDDQKFLASLMEPAEEELDQQEPDFDEDEFMFSS
jgi:hypothetical protein